MPTPAASHGASPGPSSSAGSYFSHGARLDALLTELMRRTPELEAAAVVTVDGLPMASALPAGDGRGPRGRDERSTALAG